MRTNSWIAAIAWGIGFVTAILINPFGIGQSKSQPNASPTVSLNQSSLGSDVRVGQALPSSVPVQAVTIRAEPTPVFVVDPGLTPRSTASFPARSTAKPWGSTRTPRTWPHPSSTHPVVFAIPGRECAGPNRIGVTKTGRQLRCIRAVGEARNHWRIVAN